VQVDLLSGGAETKVVLNLFDDFVVTATCDRVEQNTSGGFAWLGHIDGEETGEVTPPTWPSSITSATFGRFIKPSPAFPEDLLE
jgi:hypothetical protein